MSKFPDESPAVTKEEYVLLNTSGYFFIEWPNLFPWTTSSRKFKIILIKSLLFN